MYLEYVCETPSFAYIVMEYVEGGELFNRIVDEVNEGKGIGENLTKFYAWQILNALSVSRFLSNYSQRSHWISLCNFSQ